MQEATMTHEFVPCDVEKSAIQVSDPKLPVASICDDSDGEQTAASTNSSVPSENEATTTKQQTTSGITAIVTEMEEPKRFQTLKERAQTPPGIYISNLLVVSFLYSSGLITNFSSSVAPGVLKSFEYVAADAQKRIINFFDFFSFKGQQCFSLSKLDDWLWYKKTISTILAAVVVGAIYYLLLVRPFRAGMWTGTRAKRHRVHRYMGLLFLIQYSVAWYEFITNYEGGGKTSYLPVTIALNGIVQATSAYFSFKVLPNLADAGFYSDKAVLSRYFVFENLYYQIMSLFGSIYYNDELRFQMQSSILGKGLELLFVFFPFVFLRPWFPTTRMSEAGTSISGRSKANERFYIIATLMIKFFYLWAKYFLGFFINWYVFLGKPTGYEMKFIRGLFLLNVGTISIAVFLHTLRFKKLLAPRLMFSIYLGQVYATFSAVPIAYAMFTAHPLLASWCFAGLPEGITVLILKKDAHDNITNVAPGRNS